MFKFSESMNVFVQSRAERLRLSFKDAALSGIGRMLNALGSPAKVRPFEYVDPETDETVYLYTDKRLSVLCVGSRRYYFERITGKFDGVLTDVMDVPRGVELAD